MLLEERWRGIDSVQKTQSEFKNPMHVEPVTMLSDVKDLEMFNKLEGLAKSKLKIPFKHNRDHS